MKEKDWMEAFLMRSHLLQRQKHSVKRSLLAQWIHLCLPSFGPGLESRAHHLCFWILILNDIRLLNLKLNCEEDGK